MAPARRDAPGKEIERERRELKTADRVVLTDELVYKLNPASTYPVLERVFPAVAALSGMDQKTPFHTLTADAHSQELARLLPMQTVYGELSADEKMWATLAAYLHDIGKGHPDGRQEDAVGGRVMYAGHEKVSAMLVKEEIMPLLDLSGAGAEFVLAMVENHGLALRLIDAFKRQDGQPKGGEFAAYDEFVFCVDKMQGSEKPEGRLRNLKLMIAFTKSDVASTVNEETAKVNGKMVSLIEAETDVLDRLERALPALVEAVEQRRKGRQRVGVISEDGVYRFKDFDERIAYDTKGLSLALKAAGIHPKALGLLQKTHEAELQVVLGNAGFAPDQIAQVLELAAKHRQ